MSEIVTLQVGGSGIGIGLKLWELVNQEHFGKDSVGNLNILYESNSQHYPRSLFVDMNSCSMDEVQSRNHDKYNFRIDNFISSKSASSGLYSIAYNDDVNKRLIDSVRKEVEKCENLECFRIIHSTCGGSGSGITKKLLEYLGDEYFGVIKKTITLLPSDYNSNLLEVYNSVLSFPGLVNDTDLCVCVDNSALYNICRKEQTMGMPTFDDCNSLVVKGISQITCSLRFGGSRNSGIQKMVQGLTPFSSMHYVNLCFAPLCGNSSEKYRSFTITEISKQCLDHKNVMNSCDPRHGRYISAGMLFRGENISEYEVDMNTFNPQNRSSTYFVEWLPNNIFSTICSRPQLGLGSNADKSVLFIGNTTSIRNCFQKIRKKFQVLYRRKSFIHMYVNEGSEIQDFVDSNELLLEVADELQEFEEAVDEDDEDFEDYSDEEENEGDRESLVLQKKKVLDSEIDDVDEPIVDEENLWDL